MKLLFLGAPNLADAVTVTAGSAVASYPAENLRTRNLSSIWRSASSSAGSVSTSWMGNAWISQNFGGGYDVDLGGLYLGGLRLGNRAYADLRWRVRAHRGANLRSCVHPAPASISAVTNLTGFVDDIQETPYNPDSNWLIATTKTSNTVVRIDFDPSATDSGALPLRAGANLQTVNLWLRKSGASGTDPTATIKLYEGTTLISTLGTVSITNAVGQFVQHTFNASALSSLASVPSIQVEGTAGSAHTVEVGAAELLLEHTGYTHDSGELTPVMNAADEVTALAYIPASAITMASGDTSSVLLDMKGITATWYAEAGRLIYGPALSPSTRDHDFGATWTWVDPSLFAVAIGGQEWPTVRRPWREFRCSIRHLTESEAFTFFDQLMRLKGVTGDLVVFPQPANSAQFYNQTIYGRLLELKPVELMGQFGDSLLYGIAFAVKESL